MPDYIQLGARCRPNRRRERWALLQFLLALVILGAMAGMLIVISVTTSEAQRDRVKAAALKRPAIDRAMERSGR